MSKNLRIFSVGLGKNFPDPEFAKKAAAALERDISVAAQSGFDITSVHADAKDVQRSMDEVKAALMKGGPWDGVTIGFGLRGTAELTPMFETMVNVVRDHISPSTRMMFPPAPSELLDTCMRNFPDRANGSKD